MLLKITNYSLLKERPLLVKIRGLNYITLDSNYTYSINLAKSYLPNRIPLAVIYSRVVSYKERKNLLDLIGRQHVELEG